MKILGVWDGHDSGAVLLVDGRIAAAINEERLSRRKLEVRFPAAAIAACLHTAGVAAEDVAIVAACGADVAKTLARLFPSLKENYYQIRRRKAEPGPLSTLRKRGKYWLTELGPNPLSRIASRRLLAGTLRRLGLGRAHLTILDHHDCHAAAGAWTSGFDPAVVVTLDGVGDGRSSTISVFEGGQLRHIAATSARSSPGIFFEHVTNLLNMRELEDEGKVMALASYAPPLDANPLRGALFADGLRFRTEVAGHALYRRLRRTHWRTANEQFASMAQDALEHACVGVVREAVRVTGVPRVVLSGGVASNIQINRRIRLLPEVADVFVFPHMGDGGLALGAALLASANAGATTRVDLSSLALGPGFDRHAVRRALEEAALAFEEPPCLDEAVASLIAGDGIVYWFQGRMEYGPRALGQRSILARPDSIAVRDRLNLLLKRRAWYQPFCPTILESDARRLFGDWKGSPDRRMTMAYEVAPACRPRLAGVVAADGTCRPQIVEDDSPADIAGVLRAMKRRSGLGAVLNTSFNIHGEPLVCTPADAIGVFRRTRPDALAIGPFLVRAPAAASAPWTT